MNGRQADEGDLGQMVATQTQRSRIPCILSHQEDGHFTLQWSNKNTSINHMQKDLVMDVSQN